MNAFRVLRFSKKERERSIWGGGTNPRGGRGRGLLTSRNNARHAYSVQYGVSYGNHGDRNGTTTRLTATGEIGCSIHNIMIWSLYAQSDDDNNNNNNCREMYDMASGPIVMRVLSHYNGDNILV